MSTIPYPPQRTLSVGEILDLAFRIYRATLVKCLLFSALAVIAGQLPNLYNIVHGRGLIAGAAAGQTLLTQWSDPGLWVTYLVGVLLQIAFYAAVLLRQRRLLTDGAVGGELASGLRRVPALIGLGILVTLSLIACFLPAILASGVMRAVLVLVGLIPAGYIAVEVLCAQTILLIEGLGPVGSYARSWRLSTGSFWRLSLIYTIAVIMLLAVYFTVIIIFGSLAAILGRGDVAVVTAAGALMMVAALAAITPFSARSR